MKLRTLAAGFLAGAILTVSYSFGIEFQARFSGGLNRLSPSQVNAMLSGWATTLQKEADLYKWGYQGAAPAIHSGLEFQAELIVFLNPKIAVSLGAGCLYKDLSEKDSSLTIQTGDVASIKARPTKVSAVPFELSVLWFIPLRQDLRFYLKAGTGMIAASYTDREANWKEDEKIFLYPTSQVASANGWTYQAGIGVSYQLEPTMGFFLEAMDRSAKATDFIGENKAGLKGSLYYLEEYHQDVDSWQSRILISPVQPEGGNVRSVRKVVVDFSGVSVRFGLSLKF